MTDGNINANKISVGRLIIMLLMVLIVVVSGTFAWLTYSSKESALVLTIGDVNDTQIKLSPYQIKGTMAPVNNYTSGVYSEVEIVNGGGRDTSVTLFYKVNELDQELIDNGLKYTITSSSSQDGNYSEVKTGDFSEFSGQTEAVILDAETEKAKTVYYRVYLWVDSNEGEQSAIQDSNLDVELNGSIGSVTITGINVLGNVLTASVVDSSSTATYKYQWFSSETNSTTGGTALTEATSSNTYTIGSGLADKYIYVVVNVIEDYYSDRVYTDVTDSSIGRKDASMTVSTSTLNVRYPTPGTFTYTYDGDGVIRCNSSDEEVAKCSINISTNTVSVIPQSAPGNATIAVNAEQGTNYNAVSKDVAVTVTKGSQTGGTVEVIGNPVYNGTLTAEVTATDQGSNSYTYQWWYSSVANSTAATRTNINGATGSTYTIGSGLVGKFIGVTVIAKKDYYNDRTLGGWTTNSVAEAQNSITVISNPTIYVTKTQDISTLIGNAKGTLTYSIKSQTTTGSSLSGKTLTAGVLSADNDNDGDVVVTVTDDGGNDYVSSSVEVTVTVQKYTRTLTWASTAPSSVTYGDNSKSATVTLTGSGGTAGSVSYTSSGTSYLTINSSTGALTPLAYSTGVTITASLARTTTVKAASSTKSIAVARANGNITLTETTGTITYGTASKTFTVKEHHGGTLSVSDNHSTASVSISSNTVAIRGLSSINAGISFVVTVTSAQTAQYKAASATYTLTVNKAQGSCSVAITGTNMYGEILTATITTASDGIKSYNWYSSSGNIPSGGTILNVTTQTYTVGVVKQYIYVSASVGEGTNYTATSCKGITTSKSLKRTPSMSTSLASLNVKTSETGTFTYTYDGDGTVYCVSSDTSYATCSIDETSKTVTVIPVNITTSAITIGIYAGEGAYYASLGSSLSPSKTVSVNVLDDEKPSTPTIAKTDYNTFTYSATDNIGVAGYYVSTSADKPAASASGWVTTTSYDVSAAGTYYVWAKDAAGNVSEEYASISAYTISRVQGNGTLLVTRYDADSGTSGTEFSDNMVMLSGTNVWVSVSATLTYHNATIMHGSTILSASGESFVVSKTETITSSATANSITISLVEHNNPMQSPSTNKFGYSVCLSNSITDNPSTNCRTESDGQAVFDNISVGTTYYIWAGKNSREPSSRIYSGVSFVAEANASQTAAINYYGLKLVKGTGISAVSNGGSETLLEIQYLYNSSAPQEISIDATVSEYNEWSTWSLTQGTQLSSFEPGTKSQNIKMGAGAATLTANAVYAAAVEIETIDYNTFSYSAEGAMMYYVSTEDSVPTISQLSGVNFSDQFALNTWMQATNTGDLTLSVGTTYYVYACNDGLLGNVSANRASISTYSITREQGVGTTLTTKHGGASGTEFIASMPALEGTKIYASVVAATGYNTPKIQYSHNGSGGAVVGVNVTLEANASFISSATANTYTINYYNGETLLGTSSHTYGVSKNLTSWEMLEGTVLHSNNGWEFAGWIPNRAVADIDFEDGEGVQDLSSTNNAIVNLYSVYERTVYFYGNMATSTGEVSSTSSATQYWNVGHCISYLNAPSIPTLTSWTAQGWSNAEHPYEIINEYKRLFSGNKIYLPAQFDNTLYAIYKKNYEIKYVESVGSGTSNRDLYLSTYKPQSNYILLKDIDKEYYLTGIGWNTNPDATTVMYESGGRFSIPYTDTSNSIELHAIYRKNKATIKYNVNGGQITNSTTDNGVTNNWSTEPGGNILKNGEIYTQVVEYDEFLISTGLANWNNPSFINITLTDLGAKEEAEWFCLDGQCEFDVYHHDEVYGADAFCDLASGDCEVTLGVNWKYTVYYYNGKTLLDSEIRYSSSLFELQTWESLGGVVKYNSKGWKFHGWTSDTSSYFFHNADEEEIYILDDFNDPDYSDGIQLYAVYYRNVYFYNEMYSSSYDSTATQIQYWNPYSDQSSHYSMITTERLLEIDNYWQEYGWTAYPDDDQGMSEGLYECASDDVCSLNVGTSNKLYAMYINEVVVKYDANGGAGSMSDTRIDIFTTTYEGRVNTIGGHASNNGFIRDGYNFTNWNFAKDGSNTLSFIGGDWIDTTHFGGVYHSVYLEIILYAQWKEKVSDTYIINYFNDNKLLGQSSHTVGTAKKLTTWSTLGGTVNYGTFAGWTDITDTYEHGNDTLYSDGQSVNNLAANDDGVVNLYAVYSVPEYFYTTMPTATGEETSYNSSLTCTAYRNSKSLEYYTCTLPAVPSLSNWSAVGWAAEYPLTKGIAQTYKNDVLSAGEKHKVYNGGAYYAVYSRKQTLNYDANGATSGEVSSNSSTAYTSTYAPGIMFSPIIADNTFSRNGFDTNEGWRTVPIYNQDDNYPAYEYGDRLPLLYTAPASTTLYAQLLSRNVLADGSFPTWYTVENINSYNRLTIYSDVYFCMANNLCSYSLINGMDSHQKFGTTVTDAQASFVDHRIPNFKDLNGAASYQQLPATTYRELIYAKTSVLCTDRPQANLITGEYSWSACTKIYAIRTTSRFDNNNNNWWYSTTYGCYLKGSQISTSKPSGC